MYPRVLHSSGLQFLRIKRKMKYFIIAVISIIVGATSGYFLSPKKVITETHTVYVKGDPLPVYIIGPVRDSVTQKHYGASVVLPALKDTGTFTKVFIIDTNKSLSLKVNTFPKADSILINYTLDYPEVTKLRIDTLKIVRIDTLKIFETQIEKLPWYERPEFVAPAAAVVGFLICRGLR